MTRTHVYMWYIHTQACTNACLYMTIHVHICVYSTLSKVCSALFNSEHEEKRERWKGSKDDLENWEWGAYKIGICLYWRDRKNGIMRYGENGIMIAFSIQSSLLRAR